MLFMGSSGSQVLVAGQGDRGGVVGWWDSLAHGPGACVSELRGRRSAVSCLALLREDRGGLLVLGDESGELAAVDLRMMSASRPQVLWSLPRVVSAASPAITALGWWRAHQQVDGPHSLPLPLSALGREGLEKNIQCLSCKDVHAGSRRSTLLICTAAVS